MLMVLGLATVCLATPPRASVDDLRPGQTGFGLTVFRGTVPDTFGVTILGVQRGLRVGGDVILAELSGHGLETSAVAQGMSGSPVFLDDGRFLGAVAFGWAGALRPVAGITPVAELDLVRDRRDVALAWADIPEVIDPAALLGQPAAGHLTAAFLPEFDAPKPRLPQPARTWPSPEDLARSLVSTPAPDDRELPLSVFVVSAGASNTAVTTPASLVPGGACAVSLVLGDAQLGAIGTVSLVEGDRMVCMGHPFMQFGPVELPLSTAEIITLFPSREMSFKMGAAGVPVGRITHDQRAGLAGDLGVAARTTTVDVDLELPQGRRQYHFEVARHAVLTPQLVFWCLYNSLLAEGDDRSQQLVRYELDLELSAADGRHLDPITLTGVTGGPGGVAALTADWQAPVQILMGNRHVRVSVEHVQARLEVERPVQVLSIAGLQAPNRLVPGQPFTVSVDLERRHGQVERQTFQLIAPASLPNGPMRLGVGSAREFFNFDAARARGLFTDHTLETTVELLNRPRNLDELVVALVTPERGFTAGGRELAQLPGSVRSTLASGPPQAMARTQASYILRQARRLDALIVGTAVQDLIVAPQRPIHTEGDRP